MLFIDDDELQIAERQEERRACADDNAGAAMSGLTPCAAAFCIRQAGMPGGRRRAEPGFETREDGLRQRDFRQEDEDLRIIGL